MIIEAPCDSQHDLQVQPMDLANGTASAAAATLSSGPMHSLNKKVGCETECPMHTLFSFIENESVGIIHEMIEFVHSYHNRILTQW
jgi:hypothetical protein